MLKNEKRFLLNPLSPPPFPGINVVGGGGGIGFMDDRIRGEGGRERKPKPQNYTNKHLN